VTRYDHAAALQRGTTPARKLAYLVGDLRRWAVLNPGLMPLYREFERVLRDDFGTEPEKIPVQGTGRDQG
jgi:hypothetical protein